MRLDEREWMLPKVDADRGLIGHFAAGAALRLNPGEAAVRFVVSETGPGGYRCEVGVLRSDGEGEGEGVAEAEVEIPSIFEFRKRAWGRAEAFNVVLLVPTGVHAELGGHAGDAGAMAGLMAGVADTLITHPNVVNGSDINELPANGLYVEGSVICRLLMGTAGLRRVRSNRVLLVIDKHEEVAYSNAAINALNAARACYGLDSPRVLVLDPPVRLYSEYTSTGRAAGRVENLGGFLAALAPYRGTFDALAVSSVIDVPPEAHQEYFDSDGSMVNPWGGVEAIFTHTLSLRLGIPSAHSPMIESEEIEAADPGVVDPRMAAEAVSITYLQSVLKGLKRSPGIVTDPAGMADPTMLTAMDVSCLVIPNGCLGLPILAALEQGIPVVAVRDASVLVKNDLSSLPWGPGQFCVVDNYLEAAGVLCAMKQGLSLDSLRRPIMKVPVTHVGQARPSRKWERGIATRPAGVR
jgi:hypothetical protein